MLSTDIILKIIRWIEKATCYNDLHNIIKFKNNDMKGHVQEVFAKVYFESHRTHYQIKTYYARLVDKVPQNLPVAQKDIGTDGIIVHADDSISLVQVKYRSHKLERLQRECLSGMSLEALALKENLNKLYLFSNTFLPPENISDREKGLIKYIMADDLLDCNWDLIHAYCAVYKKELEDGIKRKEVIKVKRPSLLTWQQEAVRFVFGKRRNFEFGKKQVIAACGAGKSVFADKIAFWKPKRGCVYKKILIIIPNLHLLSQWFENVASWHPDHCYCLVGSDMDDENSTHVPYTLTTDVKVIGDALGGDVVCISTYQSLDRVVAACKERLEVFDITVCDEAHRCCGTQKSNFTLPARASFPSRNMLYITATPKIYRGIKHEKVISMDDEKIFGERYLYSFKRAIEDEIISDYKIVVGLGVDMIEREDISQRNRELFDADFLCRSLVFHQIKTLLVCSTSHAKSKRLYDQVVEMIEERSIRWEDEEYEVKLMPPEAGSSLKARVAAALDSGKPMIVFNVRVFSLGTNIKSLEGVMITGGKGSVIDTVQTVSRCLRKHPDKEFGKILVPCLLETDDFEGDGDFGRLRSFLSALGTVDDAVTEEVVLKALKRGEGGKINVDLIMDGVEEGGLVGFEDVDYRLEVFDRLGNSAGFSSSYRFELLKEFCLKEDRLPGQKEIYKNIKIGRFLQDLVSVNNYKNNRDKWLQELLAIPSITKPLQVRFDNRQDPEKKASRAVQPTKRFKTLKEFCLKEDRLPGRNETFKNIKIGQFLVKLLSGNNYKNNRDKWLRELLAIPSITDQLQVRIDNIQNPEKKASRVVKPVERFKVLKEFCLKDDCLPGRNETFKNIKIGQFLKNLVNGKYYKDNRDVWIQELLAILSITEPLQAMIDNRQDPKKKASRAVKSQRRLELLEEFCKLNKKLPKDKEKYKGINAYQPLYNLAKGGYKNIRDEWLERLLSITAIKDDLQEYFDRHGI